jgi:hypothetical protein
MSVPKDASEFLRSVNAENIQATFSAPLYSVTISAEKLTSDTVSMRYDTGIVLESEKVDTEQIPEVEAAPEETSDDTNPQSN